jgi:hypothetical protein
MAMETSDDDRMRLMLMVLTKMFQNGSLPEELSSSAPEIIEPTKPVAPIAAPVSRFSALKAKMAEHESNSNVAE